MTIKDNIRRILKEETSVQTKLKNKIDSIGIRNVIKLMGLNTIVKVLDLDLNDVDTQLMLVKNFIYHTKLRDIEVSFLEVKNSASGGKIIKVYFTSESNAGNIDSFYARVLCDESEELFPFRVVPSWEPVFASRNVKIFIDTEKIKEDEEETSLQESIKRVLNEKTERISNEQLIEIFYSRLTKQGKLNFNGIILIPELEDDGQKRIIFNIDNPNDISYSQAVIENYIDKLFNKFIKIFGLDRFKIAFVIDSYLIVNTPEEFYINKTDYDNIRQSIVNVKKFRIKFFFKKVELIGDVKLGSDEFWINGDSNEINLTIKARLTNFKLINNDNQVTELSDDELNDFLNEGSNGDKYIDFIQDELYDEAMNYIWNMTTVTDQDNMSINVDLV
jgi:hypothetical protein